MKKFIWFSLFFIVWMVFIVIILDFLCIEMQMNKCLEIRVPLLTKREIIELQEGRFFDDEMVRKIYLSEKQFEKVLNKIKENENWKNTKIDERLDKIIANHTRENIYYEIPEISNLYWIFTNRGNGLNDVHSVDEMLETHYYSVSVGILDVDNRILYYYEYDR